MSGPLSGTRTGSSQYIISIVQVLVFLYVLLVEKYETVAHKRIDLLLLNK